MEGHSAAECATKVGAPHLKMLGHGIQGDGFFHIALPEAKEVGQSGDSNLLVSVIVEASSVSITDLILGLNSLLEVEDWDWAAPQVAKKEFLVAFPNKQCLRLCLNSNGMKLPISKLAVLFAEPTADVECSFTLQGTWAKFWVRAQCPEEEQGGIQERYGAFWAD